MSKLLILAIVNTALFVVARSIDVSIAWVVVAEILFFGVWIAWKTWRHPAQRLANQAAHMHWVAIGAQTDADGFRDVLFERDGAVARVSYQRKCVLLEQPVPFGPFRDFVELEQFMSSHLNR